MISIELYIQQVVDFFVLYFRYLTVGNHDHGKKSPREWYQVAFSNIEPRWNLPKLAFSFKVSSKVNEIHILHCFLRPSSFASFKNGLFTILITERHTLDQKCKKSSMKSTLKYCHYED